MKKKIISTVLVVIMVILLAIPANAAPTNSVDINNVMSPQFTHILSMSAGLGIDSTGKATCSGKVFPSSSTYTAYLTISLEQKTSSGWTSIQSWSGSAVGYAGVNLEGIRYVVRGTYRVCSTANIYSSSGTLLETESFYSAERTY
jgi:hypothetical protein